MAVPCSEGTPAAPTETLMPFMQTIAVERYARLIKRVDQLRSRRGVGVKVLEVLRRSGYALPFFMLTIVNESAPQIFVSGGTHGDEPAGVEAVIEFLERHADATQKVGVTAFPCVNPGGFISASRCNELGYDLNRTFGQDPAPIEASLVRDAISGRHFDCALDFHEDADANGFYVYEKTRGDHQRLAPFIVERVRGLGFPIQAGDSIEGYSMRDGCVIPREERTSALSGYLSLYLFDFHCDHTLVPETPAALPMAARVAMHAAAADVITRLL